MVDWQRRSSEHKAGAGWTEAGAPTRRDYARLFEVSLRHTYYNQDEEHRCFDFDVYPNARTQALMRTLGMLFRSEGASFSVFYNTDRVDSLANFLAHNTTQRVGGEPGGPPWTYLSFFLAARNPRFANVTKIPLNLNPLLSNFYFRNDEIEADGEAAAGADGADDHPSVRLLRRDPFPVTPARFWVHIPEGGRAVIRNAAGVEIKRVDPPAEQGSGEPGRRFFVDLSQLFEGYYTLGVWDKDGNVNGPMPFIYTLAQPAPLCFIHILLSPPTPEMEMKGVYPVKLTAEGATARAEVRTIRYILELEARWTKWVYHIVPRSRDATFTTLRIESAVPAPAPTPTFDGPEIGRKPLPSGVRAYEFTSTTALELKQRSPYKLRLLGSQKGTEERVLVDRLPVASADQVLRRVPADSESGEIVSDIYVYI